jgi:hypothetical protein
MITEPKSNSNIKSNRQERQEIFTLLSLSDQFWFPSAIYPMAPELISLGMKQPERDAVYPLQPPSETKNTWR